MSTRPPIARRANRGAVRWLSLAGWLVTLVVLAAVVAGFWIVGSPAQARREKADVERSEERRVGKECRL